MATLPNMLHRHFGSDVLVDPVSKGRSFKLPPNGDRYGPPPPFEPLYPRTWETATRDKEGGEYRKESSPPAQKIYRLFSMTWISSRGPTTPPVLVSVVFFYIDPRSALFGWNSPPGRSLRVMVFSLSTNCDEKPFRRPKD